MSEKFTEADDARRVLWSAASAEQKLQQAKNQLAELMKDMTPEERAELLDGLPAAELEQLRRHGVV